MTDFQGSGLRDVGSELRAKVCHVVGEERGLVAGAGDGDLGEPRVEQIRVDAGISMNENPFGGKPLRAVTGNDIAVVEMTMLAGVELDAAVVVEASRNVAVGMDRLDGGEVAIGNAERFVGRGEFTALVATIIKPSRFSAMIRWGESLTNGSVCR